MKKVIMVLFLVIIVLGLIACGGMAEYNDSPTQTMVAEQGDGDASGGNADANTDPSTSKQDLSQEQLVGNVQAIDGTNITINTMQAMIFNEPGAGQHFVSPGAVENEPQEIIIRLTEQTVIEVNEIRATTGGGQMADIRDGTLDDLTLQAIVMATGEWQDDEFVVSSLIIMPQT